MASGFASGLLSDFVAEVVSDGANLRDVAYTVILWAASQGRLRDLVVGVYKLERTLLLALDIRAAATLKEQKS